MKGKPDRNDNKRALNFFLNFSINAAQTSAKMHWHNVNSGSIQFTITWFLHSSPFMLIYMIRKIFNHKNLFIILSRTIKIKDNRLSINLLSSDASEYHRCDGVVFQVNITAILFLSFVDTAGVRCQCFYWKTFIAHRSFQ